MRAKVAGLAPGDALCDTGGMPEPSPIDARLVALEERLAFQQQAVDQLHEVVLSQQKQIDSLSRELHACRGTIERLIDRGEAGGDLPYEKPPHY